jgi:hypothetical protein
MSEDEYNRLLKQFPEKLQGALTWKKYFERLVQAGRRTGRTDIEIGDDIRNELKGQLADSTVRNYLPPTMRHQEKANLYLKHDALKTSASESEAEPLNEGEIPEPPRKTRLTYETTEGKDVLSEIPIETEIILNCKKFATELRMGLLNNANLKLYVRNNQVSKIL